MLHCTTLMKFPDAFWGGIKLNDDAEAGDKDNTFPFILYLEYIRMPQGLTCKEYNAYIVSKGYAVDPLYEEKLNNMCR